MPLPKLLKTIIGSNHNDNKQSQAIRKFMDPKVREHNSSGGGGNAVALTDWLQHNGSSAQPAKARSLSQISGLHSHRNLKTSHQVQLAESMYDPEVETTLDSRLCYTFDQCLADEFMLPYFLQYVESLNNASQGLIKCFLQTNHLMTFLKQTLPHIELQSVYDNQLDNLDSSQRTAIELFVGDFNRVFDQFMSLDEQNYLLVIEPSLCHQLTMSFDGNHLFNSCSLLRLFNRFWTCFHQYVEHKYYESFLRSTYYLEYELEVLSSDSLHLSDILHSSTAIASTFLDFMNTEDMKNFVDFLLMHKHYKTYSRQYSDAVALYDRFFHSSGQCANPFQSFSEPLLELLRKSIRKEDQFDAECFDKIAFILMQYFSKTYLPQFVQSDIFAEYIKDCRAKLRVCKMQSHTSGKQHVDRNFTKVDSNNSGELAQCDQMAQSSVQSLQWKENLQGQLQFTYIDPYGRINSLFEHEPAKSDTPSGKLSKVIKKFTFNAEEEKKKEDDAWRIAESIINDVCSVTIDHSQSHSNSVTATTTTTTTTPNDINGFADRNDRSD